MTSWLKVTKMDESEAIIPIDKIIYIDYDDNGVTRIRLPEANLVKIQESLEEVIGIIHYLAENGAN